MWETFDIYVHQPNVNMSNTTFQVLRLRNFVFDKCSEIIIFTIIFVVKSLKCFGWYNVGPASQTVAQHYISIGPMYRVIWCFWHRAFKGHQHNAVLSQKRRIVQSPNAVSMTVQRPGLWVNIEQYWLNDTCLLKVYNRPGDR